jgi:hypothetical protein
MRRAGIFCLKDRYGNSMKAFITSNLMIMALLVLAGPVESFEGPLPIRNAHPLYTALGSPFFLSAEPEDSVTALFSYASTYLVEKDHAWSFGIDLEAAILDIRVRIRISEGTELGLFIPLVRYDAGFLDDTIESYHHMLGMGDAYGRNNRPRNDFLLLVTHEGKTVIQGKPREIEPGDMSFGIKKVVFRNDRSVIALDAFLTLPTGNANIGAGSGRPHGGLALLANDRIMNAVILYLNAGVDMIDRLKAQQEVDLRNSYYGAIGLESQYSTTISFNAQLLMQTSPFPKTGVRSIDDLSMLGSIGGRYKVTRESTIGFSITEDPDTAGAPDIMMGIDYQQRF